MPKLRRFPWPAFAALLSITAASAQDFKKQVIYQIVTDRFFNGSRANDDPAVGEADNVVVVAVVELELVVPDEGDPPVPHPAIVAIVVIPSSRSAALRSSGGHHSW